MQPKACNRLPNANSKPAKGYGRGGIVDHKALQQAIPFSGGGCAPGMVDIISTSQVGMNHSKIGKLKAWKRLLYTSQKWLYSLLA